jgi:integrase
MKGHKFPAGLSQKSGTWYALIYADDEKGVRKRTWRKLEAKNVGQAKKERADLIRDQDNGTLIIATGQTLGQILQAWLSHQEGRVRPRTIEGYRYIIDRHIIPAIGSIKMSQLKPLDIDNYYMSKGSSGRCDGSGGLSDRSVKSHHRVLHAALQWAQKKTLIKFNPVKKADAPKVASHKIKIPKEWLDGLGRFMDAARDSEYFPVFYLAIFTGLRRSELIGLKWEDVDLIGCELTVKRSMHRLSGKRWSEQPTKTDGSERTIPLAPQTVAVLRQLKDSQRVINDALARTMREDDWVFAVIDKHGVNRFLPNSVTQAWMRTARAVGLTGMRMHDARHIHATILINSNATVKDVQALLGHSNYSTTMDIYAEAIAESQRAAVTKFEEVIKYDLDKR